MWVSVNQPTNRDNSPSVSETNASFTIAIGFTGVFFDITTSLNYHRHRWLDLRTGRWVSEDPIGFRGRDTNLYRDVGNSPLDTVDPTGKWGWGKQGKLLVEKLTKSGIKRAWFQIHHLVGREIFDDPKYATWLGRIGIEKNCGKNLIALPTKLGKAKGFMPKAATHQGYSVAEYVTRVQKRIDEIMEQHRRKQIDDETAKKLVEGFQDELKLGLENGTIALNREEHDLLVQGGIISIAGLFFLASEEVAGAEEGGGSVTAFTETAVSLLPGAESLRQAKYNEAGCEIVWSFTPFGWFADGIAWYGSWLYTFGREGIDQGVEEYRSMGENPLDRLPTRKYP